MNKKIPFIEKYSPKTLNDFLCNDILKTQLENFIETKNIPNLILVGNYGTGKTCVIPCLIKQIFHKKNRNAIMEFDSYDGRGIKIFEPVERFCKIKIDFQENYAQHKLIIFDEMDNVSEKSQQLINQCLVNYPNTHFIFTCNDSQNIIDSIQSRCLKLNFSLIPVDKVVNRLMYICNEEQIEFEDNETLKYLFNISKQDIRATINLLELTNTMYEKITINNINKTIGIPSIELFNNLLTFILNKDIQNICIIVSKLQNDGYYPMDILFYFINFIIHKDIAEDIKINLLEKLTKQVYLMSKYTCNYLLLTSVFIDTN
jgi:DNA polymerase III delta prime subunit